MEHKIRGTADEAKLIADNFVVTASEQAARKSPDWKEQILKLFLKMRKAEEALFEDKIRGSVDNANLCA